MLTLLAQRRILVSAGPGGVGKTTVAASLGALAARSGRRTLVATIDPAPRLADALGLSPWAPIPWRCPPPPAGRWASPRASLSAARIDPALSFRRLVEAKVGDPEMRRRIFTNPIYRQMTTALTGSQEYAATLALYDFHTSGAYDLVVLDTPPTANALDFLDAPHRISEAVSSPVVSWFARSGEKAGRFSLRRLRLGRGADPAAAWASSSAAASWTIWARSWRTSRACWAASSIAPRPSRHCCAGRTSGFLLVLAPELPAVDEALYFHSRLRSAGFTLDAFVANRVLPSPGLVATEALRRELSALPGLAAWPPDQLEAALRGLGDTAAFLARTAEAQQERTGPPARTGSRCAAAGDPAAPEGAGQRAVAADHRGSAGGSGAGTRTSTSPPTPPPPRRAAGCCGRGWLGRLRRPSQWMKFGVGLGACRRLRKCWALPTGRFGFRAQATPPSSAGGQAPGCGSRRAGRWQLAQTDGRLVFPLAANRPISRRTPHA